MDRFEYDNGLLDPTEQANFERGMNAVDSQVYLNVSLYDGNKKTSFRNGAVLSTYRRIIWASHPDVFGNNLNCLSLPIDCVIPENCDIELSSSSFGFSRSPKAVINLLPPRQDKKPGPESYSPHNFVKFSFKDDKEAYDFKYVIQGIMTNRALDKKKESDTKSTPAKSNVKPRTGIVGIERNLAEKQKATDESISAAFKDLTNLMDMAKEMVNISKTVSSKIREKQGSITEDETIQFKSYLLSLGIDDPVTRDSYSSESKYMSDLAKQICDILLVPVQEKCGMMSLADAYCRVNRARGLELISPEDLLRACRLFEKLGLPLRVRKFDSGVQVIQLSSHDDATVVEETLAQLKNRNDGLRAEEVSQKLGISILLAKERLMTTEKLGHICRDESIEGLRFYPNLFVDND